jgi:peptide/nickel transport system substrate-binding protein
MRALRLLAVIASVSVLAASVASAQDRARTKEVVVGLGAEPRTMLAVTIVDWTTNNMLEHIYDRLLDRDAKTFKPKPMLATEWKILNDTTWEFKLRKGVKFHNGEPFTAASVKATIDYALDPASKTHFASNAYWGLVKEVQVVDDYTVRFVTKQPWPNLVDSASLTNSLIMPAKALKELGPGKLAEKPIGTGPFKYVEWRRDERLVLERNPDYWAGPADVSRLTFRFIPEFSARMAALLSGEIDVMKDVPPHAVEAIERSGRAKLRATVSSRINYVALVNLKPGPMQDVRVRRAMNHAVDVDELIKQVLKGRATRMCGPLAPANVDYAPVECFKYDPARAQTLFKEAGVDPKTLTLTLDTSSGRYPLDKDVSLAIGAQLQRLGIKTNVVVNEWGTHLDKIKNRNTGEMFFLGWGPALHGQGTVQPLFLADQTYSSYGNNKVIDDKIARAGTLLDPKARAEAYAELQRLIHEEAPWVFLWQQHDLYGVAQTVEWTPRADEKVWLYDEPHGLHQRVPDRLHGRRSGRRRRRRGRGRPHQGRRGQGRRRCAARSGHDHRLQRRHADAGAD